MTAPRNPGRPPSNAEPPRDAPRSEAELRALVSSIVQETIEARTSGGNLLKPRHPLRMALIALFLVSLGFLLATSGLFRKPPTVPAAILGTWTTDAPSYKDRTFEITPTAVLFSAPGIQPHAYTIRRVTHTVEGGSDVYVIDYDQDGTAAELSLSISERARHGDIHFTHQPSMTWHRGP